MVLHATTRRNVIIGLALIWLLVCGGLSWATWSAVQLDRHMASDARERAIAAQKVSHAKTAALAMAHLDAIIDATLGPERYRPIEHYQRVYLPANTDDPKDDPPLLKSPLQSLTGPNWLLLHFQATASGWSSPQLDTGGEFAAPVIAIPAADRERQATPENWLAALRERYDPFLFQQEFEVALNAEVEKRITLDEQHVQSGAAGSEDATPVEVERTAAEFAKRGQRLIQLQRDYFPNEQCKPQPVVMENLATGENESPEGDSGVRCDWWSWSPMLPVWLDLTLEGEPQLALVRTVSMERVEHCIMQGVLIDWTRLRSTLQKELQGILPGATIEPVPVGSPWEPNRLSTIPARIVADAPPPVAMPAQTSSPRWNLVLTWGATILALIAITYGAMKYVTMAERRIRFVSAVTHELRTPLTSFQLYTDLLADSKELDGAKRQQYVDTLRGESKRLARLVENVLVYSKIGGAEAALQKRPITAREILESIKTETAEQCRSSGKQLTVENECSDDLKVETDSEFVIQILSNLVENACKYSTEAEDPRIWLSARPAPGEGVVFEVEDAGPGVSPADRKAVFEPFRRGDSSNGGQASGIGLGLALSRYWATCLGGQLALKRSDRNGEHYSRFVLSLPHHAVA